MFFFFFDDDQLDSGITLFEDIRHVNEYGQEFWYARELQGVLGYKEWRNFEKVINKAKESCKMARNDVSSYFVDVNKSSPMPNGGDRAIDDIALSRYACYLIAQNGDPRKESIALAQAYFAVQTRRQELRDEREQLEEDQRRLAIREEMKEHNKALAAAAKDAGVESPLDFSIFQRRGYQGLYGGLGAKEIGERKGLKSSEKILDHMGSEELAANLFRATQTEAKLRREGIKGKKAANDTHFQVGQKVRQTIEELGGTMPEDLPTPDKSIHELENGTKKKLPGGDL